MAGGSVVKMQDRIVIISIRNSNLEFVDPDLAVYLVC